MPQHAKTSSRSASLIICMPKKLSFLSRKTTQGQKKEEPRDSRPQTPQALGKNTHTSQRLGPPPRNRVNGSSASGPHDGQLPPPEIPDDEVPAGPAPSASLPDADRKLWGEAWARLAQEHSDITSKFDEIVARTSSSAATLTVSNHKPDFLEDFIDKQLRSIKRKQWRLELGKLSVGVRGTIERVIDMITTTKDFATQAAALDPVHAGLPVAALCLIITVWDLIPGAIIG